MATSAQMAKHVTQVMKQVSPTDKQWRAAMTVRKVAKSRKASPRLFALTFCILDRTKASGRAGHWDSTIRIFEASTLAEARRIVRGLDTRDLVAQCIDPAELNSSPLKGLAGDALLRARNIELGDMWVWPIDTVLAKARSPRTASRQ